jgi:hypothetical protein
MIEQLFRSGRVFHLRGELEHLQRNLMSKDRYDAVMGACNVESGHDIILAEALRIVLETIIKFGSVAATDQWVLDYNGQDAKDEGVFVNIGGDKPHRRGLLNYVCAQLLKHCQLPIAVDMEPRVPHNKLTPTVALVTMAERLQQKLDCPLQVYADSAFATAEAATRFESLDSKYFLQLSTSNACKFNALHAIAKSMVPGNKAYRFRQHDIVIEIASKGENITGVMTNCFPEETVKEPPPRFSYSLAVDLMSEDIGHIKEDFVKAQGFEGNDLRRLIQTVTGQDVALPPPDQNGDIVITEDTLKKMTSAQLLLLVKDLRAKSPKTKTKQVLITHILKHHPLANVAGKRKHDQTERRLLKDKLFTQTTDRWPIVENYQLANHFVDNRNEEFFKVFDCAFYGTYPKLLFFAILMSAVLNASAAYQEWKWIRHLNQRHSGAPEVQQHRSYIIEVCKQIYADK